MSVKTFTTSSIEFYCFAFFQICYNNLKFSGDLGADTKVLLNFPLGSSQLSSNFKWPEMFH